MFSGGLDSLAGAAQELSQTNDRILLVSHRSSDWVFSRQRDLASALSSDFPGRALHVPVEVTMQQGLYEAEFTQRTRTFLFFAIGSVVAEMMGCARIRFFENGIMSFNLPIAPQIVGSRATRSTHPLALAQMTGFATNVLGRPFEVTNPFVWRTKAEVVRLLQEHGQADLIARSISCTHIRKAGQRAHCGECAQCLHRRFGTLAAGLADQDPLEGYEVELLADDRKDGAARSMSLSLVSSALEYPRLSAGGFMNKYAGEVLRAATAFRTEGIEAAVQKAYELHCRYGSEIGKVIDNAIGKYALDIRERTLPPGCLLRSVITDHQVEVNRTALDVPWASAKLEQGEEDFKRPARIELAFDQRRMQLVIDGLGDVGTVAHFVLVSALATQYRADLAEGLKPDNHGFVPTKTLMDLLGIDSETALRQRISEFRKRVVELARDRWGLPLGRGAVIENKFRAGYRLNPAVVLIDPAQIGAET
jgi:7-cyano-7-deazaguanine synthase in queuosine biosynthesis